MASGEWRVAGKAYQRRQPVEVRQEAIVILKGWDFIVWAGNQRCEDCRPAGTGLKSWRTEGSRCEGAGEREERGVVALRAAEEGVQEECLGHQRR